ncbi:MAG: hypothetical protein WCB74_28145, partial [Pseudolabrys sp.]
RWNLRSRAARPSHLKHPTISVLLPSAFVSLTPPWQDDQLMSERRILCFKPTLRLKWRGQGGQYET